MSEKIKIWCNNLYVSLNESEEKSLRDSLAEYDFRLFKSSENGSEGESADFLNQADIAFGSPNVETLLKSENIKWIHINSAGYTNYDREDFKNEMNRRGVKVTNSSSVYDEPCAQHLLAMIVSLARKLPESLDEQRGNKSWKHTEFRSKINLLNHQTVLIFGFGAIAKRLVEFLKPLEMNLIGVRRKINGDEKVKIITEDQTDEYLATADHIVNILPDNQGTQNYFDSERLTKLKPTAIFYNIGRGTTVDQTVLIDLLEKEKIAAAYLDVTNPEPLPIDNSLWTTKNCYITPHSAGGSSVEKERQIEYFLDNLKRFTKGEELIGRILND